MRLSVGASVRACDCGAKWVLTGTQADREVILGELVGGVGGSMLDSWHQAWGSKATAICSQFKSICSQFQTTCSQF